MNPHYPAKTVPRSAAIFGANGHIGGTLASWWNFRAPQARLRLQGTCNKEVQRPREGHADAGAHRAPGRRELTPLRWRCSSAT